MQAQPSSSRAINSGVASWPGDNTSTPQIGRCLLHNMATPCPYCSSAPQPIVYPPGFEPLVPSEPMTGIQVTSSPAYGYRFLPKDCDHCFCEQYPDAFYGKVRGGPDHEGCCNCGVRRISSEEVEG